MMKSLSIRNGVLQVNELSKVKARAMRLGVWFRVLTRAERAQVELTMRIVKRIRSLLLAEVVTSIVKKLLDAMKSKVECLMREIGQPLARKLSGIAQKWGNKSAHHWKEDPSFVRYLAVNYMNMPAMFKG